MLARVYSKKKKRPLLLTDGASAGGEYSAGMPRPPMMQQHHPQEFGVAPPRTSRVSRVSRAFGGGKEKDGEHKKAGLVKRVFGKRERANDYDAAKFNGGGVIYSDEDECDFDEEQAELSEEEEPEMLRPRRRFVRSGLSTYEQLISKNSMARRFSRRSASDRTASPMTDPTTGRRTVAGPVSPVYDENSPVNRDERGESGEAGPVTTNMSSLSSALQEVIHSRPTALKSIVDPSARPTRVQKSFVVEQNANGDFFVASRRVPDQPVRQTKDDSFIESMTAGDAEFQQHQAAAAPGRRSDMDFVYRNKRSNSNALAAVPGASPGTVSTTAALLAMGTAGIRRRLSGADRGLDTISNTPIATAGPPGRRSSNAGKARDPAFNGQGMMNHMAMMYMDHVRNRSTSQASDGYPAMIRGRKESTAMLQARSSFEDIDAVPMSMDDLLDSKVSTDAGPMTMDEFMFEAPPPPPIVRKNSGGKSSRARRASKAEVEKEKAKEKEEEEEVESMFTQSFRNLKDVDALKRSRSFEEDDKVTSTTEETETEEEYPDYAAQRNTDDYGSSYDSSNFGSSYEDDSAVRTSNISEFLGGFKSRNSMNRNSLGGRNSLGRNSAGRNSDFVSRAARSLRNSRKIAQEVAQTSSELSRKLREARARVPVDLRGDPPTAQKKRGFLHREGKRVRFDMNNYIREFEVIEPEPSDDDNEVQRWQQRDSEMDDDDDDEDEEEYENSTDDDCGDFGVPIPGAVLKAAMNDATAFYSNMPPATTPSMAYAAPSRMSNGGAKLVEDDKRVSVVSRKSNGNQFEILL